MDEKRLRIGELLIEAGVLNHGQLREALEMQKRAPKPLGQILVEAGFVTEAQLIQALSRQLSIPWVSLWHIDVAPELLAIVTAEEAEKYHLLPIYARTVRGERPALFVAMDDPTNQEALEFVRQAAGMEVRPMIAAPTDLRQAIRALYRGEEEEEEEELPPAPPLTVRRSTPPPPRQRPAVAGGDADDALELTEPAAEDEAEQAGGTAGEPQVAASEVAEVPGEGAQEATGQGCWAAAAPPETGVSPGAAVESGGEVAAPSFLVPGGIEIQAQPAAGERRDVLETAATRESAAEGERQRRRLRRALAFTFLDGTSIAIGGPAEEEGERKIRLAELVAALRRYADDPNVPEPLGPRGLSRIVAALLEILARKALVTERELEEAIECRSQDR